MRSFLIFLVLAIGVGFVSCRNDGKSEDGSEAREHEFEKRELDVRKIEREQLSKRESGEPKVEMQSLKWESYHNGRFEFCAEYPSNFLRPRGESENNDGNVFVTENGSSEMRASGMYNVLDESIVEAFKSATAKNVYYDSDHHITYKQQKGDWFVISGTYFESIFYVKTILKGDRFYTIYFEYHPSERKQFDEIIKRVAEDFPGC